MAIASTLETTAMRTHAARSSRRGGKPKGYKHTNDRLVVGDLHASQAARDFLQVLNEHLPATAFDELLKGTVADVPNWTRKWGIHAPCVIESATSNVLTAEDWPDVPAGIIRKFGDSYRAPDYPEPWRVAYVRLNQLKVEVHYLDDVLDSPIEGIASDADISADEKRLGLQEGALVDARALCARLRDEALQKERVLAPIAADPVRESRDQFLARAARHWSGRAVRARAVLDTNRIPYKAPAEKRGLADYLNWLVRRRIQGHSVAAIADSVGAAPDTVRDGIREAKRLLRLIGPARRAGRPRKVAAR